MIKLSPSQREKSNEYEAKTDKSKEQRANSNRTNVGQKTLKVFRIFNRTAKVWKKILIENSSKEFPTRSIFGADLQKQQNSSVSCSVLEESESDS